MVEPQEVIIFQSQELPWYSDKSLTRATSAIIVMALIPPRIPPMPTPTELAKEANGVIAERSLDAVPLESLIIGLENRIDTAVKHSTHSLEKTKLALDKTKNCRAEHKKQAARMQAIGTRLDSIDDELDKVVTELEKCRMTARKASARLLENGMCDENDDAIKEILGLLHCNSTEGLNNKDAL